MKQNDRYKFYAVDDFVNDEAFWLWVVEEAPDQVAFWTKFTVENPTKKADIQKARQLIIQLNQKENKFSEARTKQLWQRITETQQSLPQEESAAFTRPDTPYRWVSMAAVLTLLFISGAVTWFYLNKSTPVTLATTYGERKEFRLPDSSVVLLNANSQIWFTDNWGTQTDREMWLTGEGFFKIKPKKNKQKFILHAGNVDINVLGTTFNVNNRRKEIQVVLNTGQIALALKQTTNKPLLLRPGDYVAYQENRAGFVKKTVDPETFLAWKNNLLAFEAEPLENVFQLLQDQYNLIVVCEDSTILKKKFTGTVPADNLSVLFLGLQEGYNLNITQTENKVLIKNRR